MSFIQVKQGECSASQTVGYSSQGIWGKSEVFFFFSSINLFGCIGSSLQYVVSLLHYAGSFTEVLGFSSCGTGTYLLFSRSGMESVSPALEGATGPPGKSFKSEFYCV